MVVLALIAVAGLFALVGSLIGLVLTLVVAGLVGLLAERITDRIVPGEMPYGFLGAIFAGIVGSWVGALLLGRVGPVIFGIPIISALVGAIVVTLIYALLVRQFSRRAA